MSKEENRLNFRMSPETAEKLEHWFKLDGCRSKNEFLERAVNYYADNLAAETSTMLPRSVQSAIDGRLQLLEQRLSSLLFKQTVELDIAVTHFEEKDQFAGRAEIRNILQSTMRGGQKYWNFESYNPPISRDNWANKDSLEERADRLCHKSTYLQAPPEWLGQQFLDEAEHLKATDERAYQHEYLGISVGIGGNVFENLELREITDEEISRFDRIYQGVDYGWFPDPFAFIRAHYDKARETIYLIDEIYQNKLSNEQSAGMIKAKGYTDAYIVCDSAEPKSVADFRASGLPAKAAVKGPDSVAYGMKWLQRRKIVIDHRRTPHAYDEFVNYEYDQDKDGNWISGYPDEKNHLIDALRYAVEPISRRMGVIA